MPRKTDSNNPADWLFLARADLDGLQELARQEIAYSMCRSKLAEVLEKVIKADLIRTGWPLEKTHDLTKLHELLKKRSPNFGSAGALCDDLAEAYFANRYPGFDLEDPEWPKLRDQLREIENMLSAVKALLTPTSN